jgi:signal transduction histidine kinase/CheY-like chemotaxis protein/HPt (histidine-containing phosphotransfer) domain-containing protein
MIPKTASLKYLILLTIIFIIGINSLVWLNYYFQNKIEELDFQETNEQAHIAIGEIILDQINLIERNYYQLFLIRNERILDKLLNSTQKLFATVRKAFDVLENGGKISVIRELNLVRVDDFITREIHYLLPESKELSLEAIDLKPKLVLLENNFKSLASLIQQRNQLTDNQNHDFQKLLNQKITLAIKTTDSHFVRMRENASRLYYNGTQNLTKLQQAFQNRKKLYNKMQTYWIIGIICTVMVFCLLIARQIEMINRELIHATEQAKSASLAKTDFLANMSHEIRTPMNGVIGMTRLVLDMALGEEEQKLLANILYSAESLLGILNDILDFSKIEAGQLTLEETNFSLNKLLHNVVSTLAFQAEDKKLFLKNITASTQTIDFVIGDELRLKQILINLIGNAIKFTSKGGVTVCVETKEQTDQIITLLFTIQDTGIGISQEKQDTIFESFSQADSSTAREFGGTGLGLAICKQLVALMNGTIHVKSIPDRGSTFYFTINVLPGTQEKDALSDTGTGAMHLYCVNILLVEDNPVNRDLARIVLVNNGQQVTEAKNGFEALEILTKKSFDVILMDMQMPKMDGLTATKIIRNCEKGISDNLEIAKSIENELITNLHGKHIPIIALTANVLERDRQKSLDAGMDSFLTKPFVTKDLFQALNNTLGVTNDTPKHWECQKDLEEQKVNQTEEQNIDKHKQLEIQENSLKQTQAIDFHDTAYQYLQQHFKIGDNAIEGVLKTMIQSMRFDLKSLELAFGEKNISRINKFAKSIRGGLLASGFDKLAEEANKIKIYDSLNEQNYYTIKSFISTLNSMLNLNRTDRQNNSITEPQTNSQSNAISFNEQARKNLKQNYNFDDKSINEVLKSAALAMRSDLNALEKAINDNDISRINQTAHSIKGALSNLGFKDFAQEAHSIQLMASIESDNVNRVKKFLKDMADLID